MLQERVEVTPALAAAWLENNTHNRPISERTVERYAQAMRDGQWQYNPLDPLGFRKDGTCCQGQHRLWAVVQSGLPQVFDIRQDVPDDLFPVLDTGKLRGGADVLAILGEANGIQLAAALKWFDQDRLARIRAKAGSSYRIRTSAPTENATLLQILQEHPGVRESMRQTWLITPKRLLPPSPRIWVHYRATRVDAECCERYFTAINTGVALAKDSPALTVRNWALNNLASTRRPPTEMVAAILVKGWNRFYTQKPWPVARWVAGQEEFPKLEGEEW